MITYNALFDENDEKRGLLVMSYSFSGSNTPICATLLLHIQKTQALKMMKSVDYLRYYSPI